MVLAERMLWTSDKYANQITDVHNHLYWYKTDLSFNSRSSNLVSFHASMAPQSHSDCIFSQYARRSSKVKASVCTVLKVALHLFA